MQNVFAELHHVTGDAGDRAGLAWTTTSNDQRAGGAARSARALLAPPCGVGKVGRVWEGLPRDRAAQMDA
eukprot:6828614-Prymnesium_polylepis.2